MFVCNSVSVLFIICIIPFPYCITYVSHDVRICSVFYLLLIKTYVNEADMFLITSRSSLRKSIITSQLLTRPEHLSSHPVFSGDRVTRYLVLCVCFVDRCLFFCSFSFGHCIVCSPSIYGF